MFGVERLSQVRDIFIFQCYTGLAYADVYKLKKKNIVTGIDGGQWIADYRRKTVKSGASIDIPLLPVALKLVEKYEKHPLCIKRSSELPVISNQKMNSYLKEIAAIVGIQMAGFIDAELNTHKARRTFASTVALKNGVPIHIVKEILGHTSVSQTYAITEQESIAQEMQGLKVKLEEKEKPTILPQLYRIESEYSFVRKCSLNDFDGF